MKIIAQPCSSPQSISHYEETVINKVDLIRIRENVTEELYQLISGLIDTEDVHIWGIMNSESNVNKKKWNKINKDDIVIFYRNKEFFSKGTIVTKFKSEALAQALWGSVDGKTWEYIYLFKNLEAISYSIKDFNNAMNYSEKYILQSFSVFENDILENKVDRLNYVDSKDDSKERFKNISELESTDSLKEIKIRKEQQYLRRYLNLKYEGDEGLTKIGTCAICNRKYPVLFLHAGHIKKRSMCTDINERLDYNIVMPVCKFGCDDLYEHGLIYIDDDGIIKKNKAKIGLIPDEIKFETIIKIESIINKKCVFYSSANKVYFNWHMKYHCKD